MRHRKKGRVLGRSPSHRKAMLRNMAASLILTEGDWEGRRQRAARKRPHRNDLPKSKGSARTRRTLYYHCQAFNSAPGSRRTGCSSDASVGSAEWRDWNQAIAPVVAARRRAAKLLGDKQAVRILFDDIAPRYVDRDGGYTRVLRLAQPRLGDNGTQAILEFVGVRDRISERAAAPEFEDQADDESAEDVASGSAVAVGEAAAATDEAATDEAVSGAEESASATETDAADEDAAENDEAKKED